MGRKPWAGSLFPVYSGIFHRGNIVHENIRENLQGTLYLRRETQYVRKIQFAGESPNGNHFTGIISECIRTYIGILLTSVGRKRGPVPYSPCMSGIFHRGLGKYKKDTKGNGYLHVFLVTGVFIDIRELEAWAGSLFPMYSGTFERRGQHIKTKISKKNQLREVKELK